MKARSLALALAAAGTLLASPPARAYQSVRVGAAGAHVFAKPGVDAPVLGRVAPGTAINIGDKAYAGFYRCAAPGGLQGWIAESSLAAPAGGASQATRPPPASRNAAPPRRAAPASGHSHVQLGVQGGTSITSSAFLPAFAGVLRYRFSPQWEIGATGIYIKLADTALSQGNLLGGMGEVNYHLGDLRGAFVGLRGGMGQVSARTEDVEAGIITTTTYFGFLVGAAAGYDFQLGSVFSIGAETHALFLAGPTSSGIFNLLGAFKVAF